MRRFVTGCFFFGTMIVATGANAAPITWMTGGYISRSTIAGLNAGDLFQMTVTFDDAAIDLDPLATSGAFDAAGALFGFQFSTSTSSYENDGLVRTLVSNRDPVAGLTAGQDIYNVNNFAALAGPLFSLNFQQEVHDDFPADATMLTSDGLLALPPQYFGADTYATLTTADGNVFAKPTFAYRVPEPTLAQLLGCALGVAGFVLRRRRVSRGSDPRR